jgi:PAS domain S-box-containing protein
VKTDLQRGWGRQLPSVCLAILAGATCYGLSQTVHPIAAALCTTAFVMLLGIYTHFGFRNRQRLAERALSESELRLQLVVNGSGVAIWDSDLRSGRTYWNRRTFDLFGYEPTEDGTVTMQMWHGRLHPEDEEAVRQEFERAVKGKSNFVVEHRIVRGNGDILWVSAFGRFYYDEHGDPVRFTGMNLDITERKRAQEELRAADRRKDEFLAVLAHELRNPLAPLRDSLRLFENSTISDPTLNVARRIMQRQTTQMVRLIDDLLDVGRISRNRLELRREITTIGEAIESALETCRPALNAAGHRLNVQIPPEPLHVNADRVRLAQIFGNLLSNSTKYTPPGGEIGITVRRDRADASVSVTDTGMGIASEDLPRVFEMFTQVGRGSEHRISGLGIGLALVSSLVEMHGGSVSASSPGPGEGSTFCVKLPLSLPEVAVRTNGTGHAARADSDRRKVLVTDDNEDAATALALLLTHMGNDVQIAHNGEEALSVAAEFRPDLILMDVGMPLLDGLEATRRLRETEWGRRAAIVALTGWGQEADKRRSREAGADDHLVKPVDTEALQKVLASVPATIEGRRHA